MKDDTPDSSKSTMGTKDSQVFNCKFKFSKIFQMTGSLGVCPVVLKSDNTEKDVIENLDVALNMD